MLIQMVLPALEAIKPRYCCKDLRLKIVKLEECYGFFMFNTVICKLFLTSFFFLS